jgi:hypothetical protein
MRLRGKKGGCCGSTTLAIVVARTSWRDISLRKTQHLKNLLNSVSTCPKVVDTRRSGSNQDVAELTNPSFFLSVSNDDRIVVCASESSDVVAFYS